MRRQEQRSGDISSAHSKHRGLGAAAFPMPSVTLSTAWAWRILGCGLDAWQLSIVIEGRFQQSKASTARLPVLGATGPSAFLFHSPRVRESERSDITQATVILWWWATHLFTGHSWVTLVCAVGLHSALLPNKLFKIIELLNILIPCPHLPAGKSLTTVAKEESLLG